MDLSSSGEEIAGDQAGASLGGEESAGVISQGGDMIGGENNSGEAMAGAEQGGIGMGGEALAGQEEAGVMFAGMNGAGVETAGEALAGEYLAGQDSGGEAMAGEHLAGMTIEAGESAGTESAGTENAGTENAGTEPLIAGMTAGEDIAGMMAGTEPNEPRLGYNLCGLGANEPRAEGDNQAPIIAPYSPFLDRNDTLGATQDLYNSYDCAPDRREFGREVVYEFTLPAEAYFRAEVLDGVGVDIDLHLLQNPSVNSDGLVSGCLARDDRLIEYDLLPAGTYQLVADSWTNSSGYEYEGAYEIAFEWFPYGQWTEAPLSENMTLKRWLGIFEGAQRLVHLLVTDANYDVITHRHDGCQSVPTVLDSLGASVGINANFFNPSQRCAPTDFLRVDGTTITRNGTTGFAQRTFGWNQAREFNARWLPHLSDWTDIVRGVGGYPSLVVNGSVAVEVYEGEQVYSATDWSDQPRSAVAVTSTGQLVFAVADGRNRLSNGIFNMQWAQLLSQELELTEAIGLDGGGSSTLTVKDCWINDVVNYPSDGGGLSHEGARAVGSGLYLR